MGLTIVKIGGRTYTARDADGKALFKEWDDPPFVPQAECLLPHDDDCPCDEHSPRAVPPPLTPGATA